ncbi:MAG: hypothetical protein Q7S68_03685 [Deltaproteobacteria bacterium]|nr:hypothetical protein [Deltaproteobacteria bacterium]
MDKAVADLFHSKNPYAIIYFQEDFVPKIKEAGWQIPSRFLERFEAQQRLYRSLQADQDVEFSIGSVPVHIPYNLDMESLTAEYSSGWKIEKIDSGRTEYLYDELGRLTLTIVREEPNRSFRLISSPLFSHELKTALLWMPPLIRGDFSALLGLPDTTVEEVKEYVRRRMQWEESLSSARSIGNRQSVKYDPLCQLDRGDQTWKSPRTIRDAIVGQCSSSEEKIGFPDFSVTKPGFGNPVLFTAGQRTCLVVAIYDRKLKKGLMAHLPTTDGSDLNAYILENKLDIACYLRESHDYNFCTHPNEEQAAVLGSAYQENRDSSFTKQCCWQATFPLEWYTSVFRREYFANTNESDIEITLLPTFDTPRSAIEDAAEAFQRYFPKAVLRKNFENSYRSSWLDTSDGSIYTAGFVNERESIAHAKKVTLFNIIR